MMVRDLIVVEQQLGFSYEMDGANGASTTSRSARSAAGRCSASHKVSDGARRPHEVNRNTGWRQSPSTS